ncbi:hypothetical protein [uncultured Desulfosarcina sp.]|uniref:hypothetical protein n=1 Tax=uncultured Desulfosarcina sp. TaxID=218289 RepID=UPI0029C677A2|nr:hypothetical protein [uncultured Desulfosarcina sp.]
MESQQQYFKCSPSYIDSIDSSLMPEIQEAVKRLPERKRAEETAIDLFWLLAGKGWSFSRVPRGISDRAPNELEIEDTIDAIKDRNNSDLCISFANLDRGPKSDFAKSYGERRLVQIGYEIDNTEIMAQDFSKFRIAFAEKRLVLGIEMVGISKLELSKDMLVALDLDCPIWIIGLK